MNQTEEVYASVRIDNKLVSSTKTKTIGPNCWDQNFSIDLDRAKELEIELFYKDKRQMCAFAVLKLGQLFINIHSSSTNFTGDLIDKSFNAGKQLNLEPQGTFFFEV